MRLIGVVAAVGLYISTAPGGPVAVKIGTSVYMYPTAGTDPVQFSGATDPDITVTGGVALVKP